MIELPTPEEMRALRLSRNVLFVKTMEYVHQKMIESSFYEEKIKIKIHPDVHPVIKMVERKLQEKGWETDTAREWNAEGVEDVLLISVRGEE